MPVFKTASLNSALLSIPATRAPSFANGLHSISPYVTKKDNLPTTMLISPRRASMFDLMKKGMLAGIGLALKTWDEVEDMVQEVQKKGEMSEVEGRKFFEDVQKKYEEAQSKLEKRVEKSVNEFLKKSNIVTANELKDLKKEIRELKSIINTMTQKAE
jgi:polyhydroxyalkanoate synthesis regulator phasin